ncbi:ribulose-phosphate 3-epimerase [Candidatus Omnitrophota bacterium]
MMNKKIQVSASILCADFSKLGVEVRKCEDAGVDMLHVDVMDGHFVPPITMGPLIVEALRSITKLPIEAHLMVEHPTMHLDSFIEAGVDALQIHAECYGPLRQGCQQLGQWPKEVDSIDEAQALVDIKKIKDAGVKAFMVLNPGTPLVVTPVLNDLDGVLIMSVNPGFAKQKFMPSVLDKVKKLRQQFDGDIAIDGGLNAQTAPDAVIAGANIIATASYFFGAEDPQRAVSFLRDLGV